MTAFARLLPTPTTARALCAAAAPADVIGDPDRIVRRVGSLAATADDVLAFCDAADAAEHLSATRASVVFVRRSAHPPRHPGQTVIVVDDVRAAFIDVVLQLLPGSERPSDPSHGVEATARVDIGGEGHPLAPLR